MKKWMSFLLVAVMTLSLVTAYADDLPYIKTRLPQGYVLSHVLEDGIYPMIRLTTDSESVLARRSENGTREFRYLCFDAPEDAAPTSFDTDYAHYVDDTHKVQYSYQIWNGTIEKMRKKWSNSLINGPEGSLMHCGSGMIEAAMKVPEYDEQALLIIEVTPDWYEGFHVSRETDRRLLIASIVPEIIRVKNEMHVEIYDNFWDAEAFCGVELADVWDNEYALRVDFPQTNVIWAQGPFVVTKYDNSIKGIYIYGDERSQYTQVEIETEYLSYAVDKLKEGAEGAYDLILSNGSKWVIYFYENRILYASKKIDGPQARSSSDKDKPFYLTLRFVPQELNINITEEEINQLIEAYDVTLEELFIPLRPDITIPEF